LAVLQEEGYRCRLCGKRANAVDHIVGVAERPDLMFVRSNLQAVCTKCNTRKENQRREWAKRVDARPANRRQW
jgi:5-methylcytosine-specific restriction endonuclease McrA